MTQGPVHVAVDAGVAIVTIDRPPVNALNPATIEALDRAIVDLARPEVRAVVVTGAGTRAFVAGADIAELASIGGRDEAERFAARGQSVLDRLESLPKIVVAAINGACLGGGNELAMACHLRIADEGARFGQPEINLGIIPGFGGTQRLPRLIGRGRALELLLTGELIPARQALEIGLVNRVVPDGQSVPVAVEVARQVAAKGQVAVRLILESVAEGLDRPIGEGMRIERDRFGRVMATTDRAEGLQAFLEKRPPHFVDR